MLRNLLNAIPAPAKPAAESVYVPADDLFIEDARRCLAQAYIARLSKLARAQRDQLRRCHRLLDTFETVSPDAYYEAVEEEDNG